MFKFISRVRLSGCIAISGMLMVCLAVLSLPNAAAAGLGDFTARRGDWSYDSGVYTFVSGSGNSGELIKNEPAEFTDGTIEVNMTPGGTGNDGILLRADFSPEQTSHSAFYGYDVFIRGGNGTLRLAKVSNDTNWVYPAGATVSIPNFAVGKTYAIKIVVSGNNFKVFLDGTQLIDYTDADNSFISGQIALNPRSVGTTYSNLRIIEPVPDDYTVRRGTWGYENGTFIFDNGPGNSGELIKNEPVDFTNGIVEVKMTAGGTGNDGILLRADFSPDQTSHSAFYGYNVFIRGNNGTLRLAKVSNSTTWDYPAGATVSIPNFAVGKTYAIKIVVSGNNIKAYVDGALLIDYTDNVNPFTSGQVALNPRSVGTTYSDWIVSPTGDVNGDSLVNEDDVDVIKRHLLKKGDTLSASELERADLNKDGTVDIRDLLKLKETILD